MKKIIICFCLLAMSVFQESYAILDFFKSFSKRNKEIEKKFIEKLNNNDIHWKLMQMPLENNGVISFHFIPDSQQPASWLEKFAYTEMKDNRKKLTLDRVWEALKNNNPVPKKDGEANVLFRNDKEIQFELIAPITSSFPRIGWHMIGRFVQIDPNQIRLYDYEVRKRSLSQEEKLKWFEFFKKIDIDF